MASHSLKYKVKFLSMVHSIISWPGALCSRAMPKFIQFLKGALCLFVSLFEDLIYLLFKEEGRRDGEKHQCVVASHLPPCWGPGLKPRQCPDWESNCDPLVHRPMHNPLSHTRQAVFVFLTQIFTSMFPLTWNTFFFFSASHHPTFSID